LAPEPTLGPPSMALIERIRQNEIVAAISTHVFSDVTHRLMTFEACASFGWPYQGIAARLKKHPAIVTQLSRYRQALDEIRGCGVHILAALGGEVVAAGDLSRQHGLLSGDALILAVMQRYGIPNIATNDADFDRVPGIVRYQPM